MCREELLARICGAVAQFALVCGTIGGAALPRRAIAQTVEHQRTFFELKRTEYYLVVKESV